MQAPFMISPTKHFYEVRHKLLPYQMMPNNGKKEIKYPPQIKIVKYVTSVKEAVFSQGNATKESFLKANVILCFFGLFESLMCVRTNKKLSQLFAKALKSEHQDNEWQEHLFFDLAFQPKNQILSIIADNFLNALENRNDPESLLKFENFLMSDFNLLDRLFSLFCNLINHMNNEGQPIYDVYQYFKNLQQTNFDEKFYRAFQSDFGKLFNMRIPILYYVGEDIKIFECPLTIENTIKARFCLIIPVQFNPSIFDSVYIGYDKKSTILLFREGIFFTYKDPYTQQTKNVVQEQQLEFSGYFVKRNTLHQADLQQVKGISQIPDPNNNRNDDNTEELLENANIFDLPDITQLDSGTITTLNFISDGLKQGLVNISVITTLLNRLLFTDQKIIFSDRVNEIINYLLRFVEKFREPRLNNHNLYTLDIDPNSQTIPLNRIQPGNSGPIKYQTPNFPRHEEKKTPSFGQDYPIPPPIIRNLQKNEKVPLGQIKDDSIFSSQEVKVNDTLHTFQVPSARRPDFLGISGESMNPPLGLPSHNVNPSPGQNYPMNGQSGPLQQFLSVRGGQFNDIRTIPAQNYHRPNAPGFGFPPNQNNVIGNPSDQNYSPNI